MNAKFSIKKILLIQTAFIGDAILSTALVEKIKFHHPTVSIDLLVRKGNESLFIQHPSINRVLIWDKSQHKYKHFMEVWRKIRENEYDVVVNAQRFFSTGFLTAFSGAKVKSGFDKNPLSIFFTHRIPHVIDGRHEVERNQSLIAFMTDEIPAKPKLYPTEKQYENVAFAKKPYVTLSPASVWKTKQLPPDKWIELINKIPNHIQIYIVGGKSDFSFCESLIQKSSVNHPNQVIENLCGKLDLLSSAALMGGAVMNYVNDSAPLHLCAAMNAPVTAFFCSTVKKFGFYPLSDVSLVLETKESLPCRPCGLHGKKECPLGHFDCGKIDVGAAVTTLH